MHLFRVRRAVGNYLYRGTRPCPDARGQGRRGDRHPRRGDRKRSAKNRVAEPFWTTWLGYAYLAANRIADAQRVATVALNLARERQLRGDEAHALSLVADIAVL